MAGVLRVPAPARMAPGPVTAVAASRWASFRPVRTACGSGCANRDTRRIVATASDTPSRGTARPSRVRSGGPGGAGARDRGGGRRPDGRAMVTGGEDLDELADQAVDRHLSQGGEARIVRVGQFVADDEQVARPDDIRAEGLVVRFGWTRHREQLPVHVQE